MTIRTLVDVLAAAVAFILVVPWIFRTILAYRTVRQSAQPRFDPMGEESSNAPQDISRFFAIRESELKPLGFEVRGHYRVEHLTGKLDAFALMLVAPAEKIAALVMALRVPPGLPVRNSTALHLVTRYGDGSAIETMNSERLRPFPPPRGRSVAQLPSVPDAPTLLRVHRMLVHARGDASPRTLRPAGANAEEDSALAVFSMTEEMKRQAEAGWIRLAEDFRFYRPTWKGAAILSWNRLWPITTVRLARLRARERHLLSAAQAAGTKPDAQVAPS
ncbi:MAG TPA: hypothetical protein VKE50_10085 [Thermoanaerobaculia bacterium]|nr:hypothetical protein [Thermoanaerobaculia bacterium]